MSNKDHRLIREFDYSFEDLAGTEDTIDLPETYANDGKFKKLLGRSDNFLSLGQSIDTDSLRAALNRVPADQWIGSGREHRHAAHNQTRSLLLLHDSDNRHQNPSEHPAYPLFQKELEPLLERISSFYQGDGYFIRVLFANLLPGSSILAHIDATFSLLHCHRVHVPIITNDKVVFSVGGEQRNLKAGEIWEINNANVHAVENGGPDARIHLIADWVPNATLTAMKPAKKPIRRQVGRNDPCPCGSGEKFKNCHGALG